MLASCVDCENYPTNDMANQDSLLGQPRTRPFQVWGGVVACACLVGMGIVILGGWAIRREVAKIHSAFQIKASETLIRDIQSTPPGSSSEVVQFSDPADEWLEKLRTPNQQVTAPRYSEIALTAFNPESETEPPPAESLPLVIGSALPSEAPVEQVESVGGDNVSRNGVLPSPPQAAAEEEALERIEVPLAAGPTVNGTVDAVGSTVSLAVREAPLHAVLSLVAQQQGLSIVASGDLKQTITVTLQPTTLDNALDALLASADCAWTRRNNVIYVTPIVKDSVTSPFFQGRDIRVFSLNYAAAADVEKVVAGLISAVGKVFVREIDAKDQRRTVEQLVVEDMPEYLERISSYIAQADRMPRQVLVEAHILQVKLGKDHKHGVNFDTLARISGARVQLWNKGLATEAGPGMVFTVDGTDFNSLIDCLTTTTDAKTLASPKVLVVNGQESRIQIGRRLGYFITTTTQTSTLQNVQFLEVGVVLNVTPHITDDGQVLMQVMPKVSSGDINPATTLPEEETTEVETSILVPDGHGIIIGGLIQEIDNDRQSKLPFFGDLWLVGNLFQRSTVNRERNEVIVALLPRVVECAELALPEAAVELDRASTRLLTPQLEPAPRGWEPKLTDSTDRPTWLGGPRRGKGIPPQVERKVYSTPVMLPPIEESEILPPTAPTSEEQEMGAASQLPGYLR